MNPTDRPVISVFGASQIQLDSPEYADGLECGRLLAEAGFTVATGGYGGIMEAACRGAAEAGGPTIGVTVPAVFPDRSGANRWVQYEIPAADLVQRIGILTSLASGCMAMPGSIGTLAELMVAWNLAFVAPFAEVSFGPVVAVGELWQRLIPELADQLQTDGGFVAVAPDVAGAVEYIAGILG